MPYILLVYVRSRGKMVCHFWSSCIISSHCARGSLRMVSVYVKRRPESSTCRCVVMDDDYSATNPLGYDVGMLVCIGGFPGSGRNRLAEDISKATNWHYQSLSPLKRAFSIRGIHTAVRPHKGTRYSDELMMLTYKHITGEFPILSRMYPDMILKDHFTREVPREYFFREASSYFRNLLIVWVDATLEESEQRLHTVLADQPKKLQNRLRLIREMNASFQPFTRPVSIVRYMEDPNAAVEKVLALISAQRIRQTALNSEK